MSTKSNTGDFFDALDIEKLANLYFTALPGSNENLATKNVTTKVIGGDDLLTQGNVGDISQPTTSLPDPNNIGSNHIPKSVAGSGISPSAFQNDSNFDLKIPSTTLPDASNGIPNSVAGSGISPSALNQDTNFDLKVPATSLPDPNNIGSSHLPKSVAGSGVSPSAFAQYNSYDLNNEKRTEVTQANSLTRPSSGIGLSPSAIPNSTIGNSYASYLEHGNEVPIFSAGLPFQPQNYSTASAVDLPYESQKPFVSELTEILNNVHTYVPGQQLPGLSGSSFYFLKENNLFPKVKEVHPFGGDSSVFNKGISGIASPPFDVNLIKQDFPILGERVNGRPLIWLDNAATTQKPKSVIERISQFYQHENSNIHRAAHELAARATDAYEAARQKVQLFLNAASPNEIIFLRGATEAINLVAKTWGDQYLRKDDEIIISHLEHHANIVPWQQLAAKKGLKIRVMPVDEDGQIILDEYTKLLGPKTKLVAFTQVSNALGTVTPAKRIIELAHQAGAKVLLDGAQSISHMRVDVQALDADWFVFSGHKVYAPTGIGILFGKEALLNSTQPWQGGGNMIKDVTFENTQFHDAPGRFEAGTGNIADAVGLGAAIDYVNKIGMDLISRYENYLLAYATKLIKEVPGIRLIGTAVDKASVLSFVLDGYKTEEVGSALNDEGIAVRSGHHCAQPILRRFGLESTVRPSLAFYNTCSDIDTLVSVLHRLSHGKTKLNRR